MKIAKTIKLHPHVVKTLKKLVEEGYIDIIKGQKTLVKPTITEVIERGIELFARKHEARVYRRCKYMAEEKGTQVFCSHFNKYKDLKFCIEVCNFWQSVPPEEGE